MATICHVGLKFSLVLCISFFYVLQTGNSSANTTDPQEAKALRKIRNKLQYIDWDFGEDPCSGKGSWNKSQDTNFENYVSCNCAFVGESFCHVTHILLKRQNISGMIPSEFADLTYLEELDLTGNYLNGSIPVELGSLANLKNFVLADNYLSGPIPSQLGSLKSLKFLNLSRNLLSGSVPKELGHLANLEKLVLHSNNLSGKLPLEIGDLRMLQTMHISSNLFIGPIPGTYEKLQSLTEFWASSNNLNGTIPSNIGKMVKLEKLILQGTSLQGPIPSEISQLTQLEDLRISDITQGGNSMEFILKLKNLRTLVLRNNNITGNIPADISILSKLTTLDLSYNKLTGGIPDSVKLISLDFLFLGNNNLSGTLPTWLTSSEATIDLSYNNFSGIMPPKLTSTKVNLIWNSLSTTNHSDPTGCLQRTLPCGEKSKHYGFAINCGGKKLKHSAPNFIFHEFEEDDQIDTLSFYRGHTMYWGFSSIGYYMESESPSNSYTDNSGTTFAIAPHNTSAFSSSLDPELYRTARISPISLRYYGLDLQTGLYNIQLHFAEIQIPVMKPAKGRRIFDVYIQEDRVLKDFDIMEAAGEQNLVVIMNYTINVTKNYLDIHFFWAGKGTCCEPQDVYGPLVSAIVVTPNFKPHIDKNSKTAKIVIIVVSVVVFSGLVLISTLVFIKRRKNGENILACLSKDRELKTMDGNSFSLREMKIATKSFDPKNKIGEGGFGAVYKGVLSDGRKVAIKQLSSQSKQGNREFLNEVGTISAVQHPDVIKLYGCCAEGEDLLLVYEYMENGNVARALFDRDETRIKLDWPTRYRICLGVSRGLAYLHEDSLLKIIHRDIKSTNILLDKDLNPKVADFGLARLFDDGNTHVSTRAAGTIGYMAPEYALRGHLTEKADVYSFGVVALEIVSGRTHTDTSLEEEKAYLLEWTWHLFEERRMLELVDVNLLQFGYNEEEVIRVIYVGLLCTHENPGRRPSMSAVVGMLEGRMEIPAPQARPGYLNHWQTWQLAAGAQNNQAQSSTSNSSNQQGPWKDNSSSQKQPSE